MSERIEFGIEDTFKGSRLRVDVPQELLGRASEIDDTFLSRLDESVRKNYLQLEDLTDENKLFQLAVNARVLGRTGPLLKKLEADRNVTEVIKILLSDSPAPHERDPKLHLKAFYPLQTDFGFIAEAEMPKNDEKDVSELVKLHMIHMLRDMRYFDEGTELEAYEGWVRTEVDVKRGVDLRLPPHSAVYTTDQGYDPESTRVELIGNNVAAHLEPLAYLMGVTALAHADDLLNHCS